MMRSTQVAQDIINESERLRDYEVVIEDYPKTELVSQVVGEDRCRAFHPLVSPDLTKEFTRLLREDKDQLQSEYFNEYRFGPSSVKYNIAGTLISNITNEDLIGNKVPSNVSDYIDTLQQPYANVTPDGLKMVRGCQTPKLTRLLGKVVGERSEAMKWLTNKCPKDIKKGINEEYKVVITSLPHHMAGMSYYAVGNSDGPEWYNGWEGTSCMDTLRNSQGNAILQLPAAMKMDNVFLAYLTKSERHDIWNPSYVARCLVHVIEVEGRPLYVMCKTYATSKETMFILQDGLSNEIGAINAYDLTLGSLISYSHDYQIAPYYQRGHCNNCNGEGSWDDDEDNYCSECEGESSEDTKFYPYFDNSDIMCIEDTGSTITYRLSETVLKDKGYINPVEPVEETPVPVVAHVEEEVECPVEMPAAVYTEAQVQEAIEATNLFNLSEQEHDELWARAALVDGIVQDIGRIRAERQERIEVPVDVTDPRIWGGQPQTLVFRADRDREFQNALSLFTRRLQMSAPPWLSSWEDEEVETGVEEVTVPREELLDLVRN